MVDEYMARFPLLAPGGSRRVYNSNMAAVDDAVGVLCRALTDNSAVFGNNTLIVFTQDNVRSPEPIYARLLIFFTFLRLYAHHVHDVSPTLMFQ